MLLQSLPKYATYSKVDFSLISKLCYFRAYHKWLQDKLKAQSLDFLLGRLHALEQPLPEGLLLYHHLVEEVADVEQDYILSLDALVFADPDLIPDVFEFV